MKWPGLRDIFSFQLPLHEVGETIHDVTGDLDQLERDRGSEETPAFSAEKPTPLNQVILEKIRFDNTIRLWTAAPAYLVSISLWLSGVIPSIVPMTIVFLVFGAIQFSSTWFFLKSRFARYLDYFLCTFDLVAMSFAIYFTGGTSSTLYFIYFIPLIIHALHRDLNLILFNGLGGVMMYAAVILKSIPQWHTASLMDLGARIFFMLLTVSIAVLAVVLFRRKDAVYQKRLFWMKLAMRVSHQLHSVSSQQELPPLTQEIGRQLHKEWGRKFEFGILLDQQNSRPTEPFSFGSPLSIPILSSENESFGALLVGSEKPNFLSAEDLKFLRFLAKSLGLTIQRMKNIDELKRTVEMDSCVTAVFLGSARSRDSGTAAILEGAINILKADQASLMLWNPTTGFLTTKDVRGPWAAQEMDMSFRMGEGIPGKVLEKGTPYWTTNIEEDPNYKKKNSPIKCFACLPLRSPKGEAVGVINVSRMDEGAPSFSTVEIDIAATFAARVAVAVENAVIQEKQREKIDRHAA